MKPSFFLRFGLFAILIWQAQTATAQTVLVSEPVQQLVARLTAKLPANIREADQQFDVSKKRLDSLETLLQEAYPALADRVNKRSARLNSMANYTASDAKLSLVPPNQKMSDFFRLEWDKMDALERAFNKAAPSFFGSKALYQKQGYLPPWDSTYTKRQPALVRYRDGVLKLVQAEIAYLKTNAAMYKSSDEDEQMQWVEAELGVLQKLVLLGAKYKKLVITDGAEKVQFCKANPAACSAANQ